MNQIQNNPEFLNSQKYSECQIVSAINAARYFGKAKDVTPSSPIYGHLVDLGRARHGAAIHSCMPEVIKCLGLDRHSIKQSKQNMKKALLALHPVSFTVWSIHYGFHDVLIVDYESCTDHIKVLNLSKYTNPDCRISWAEFRKMFSAPNHTRRAYEYQTLENR